MLGVSVCIPTRGRPEWCREAVLLALGQTLPPREVLVLDDATTPDGEPDEGLRELLARDGLGASLRVFYRWLPVTNLGVKRNLLAHWASSDLLALWDDDDWCQPERLAAQVLALQRAPHATWCAIGSRALYTTPDGAVWWRRRHAGAWNDGSLVMWRAAWRRLPEDPCGAVLHGLRGDDRGVRLEGPAAGSLMVCRVHPGNTTPKAVGTGNGWVRVAGVAFDELRTGARAAWQRVTEACP